MQGEQPLLADLPALPTATDACLMCTNLRTLDGKRQLFVDAVGSTFVIPLLHVRFIEVAAEDAGGGSPPALPQGALEPDEANAELDEDILRRIREA
ncbi:MAG: hypothetical protein ACHQZR_02075 [Candidatus Limnocylindrales bacterium]